MIWSLEDVPVLYRQPLGDAASLGVPVLASCSSAVRFRELNMGQGRSHREMAFLGGQTLPGSITSRPDEHTRARSHPRSSGEAAHKKEGCSMESLGVFSKLGRNHSIFVKLE